MKRLFLLLGGFGLIGLAAAAESISLNDYLGEEWTDPRCRTGIWELQFTRPDDVSVSQEVQPSRPAMRPRWTSRIRPPQLTCAKARYNYSWWGHKPDFMYPAVFHAAYRATDGSQAVCLANATEVEQTCSMTWKGKAYDLRLAPGEIRLIVDGK